MRNVHVAPGGRGLIVDGVSVTPSGHALNGAGVMGEAVYTGVAIASDTLTPSDRIIIVHADGTVAANLTVGTLTTYLASVLGTGTGGDPVVPPDLPPTASVNVPLNRPDGAIIARVNPVNLESPTATWTMTPYTGLDIYPASGDVFLDDASDFFAAIGSGTASVTVTATNTGGIASSTITFSTVADYDDLPTANAPNLWANWDIIDNREVRYDSVSGLATFIGDKSPENRDAQNPQEKMSYVLTSNLGAGKPSIRGNGASGPTSGMMFNQNTFWRGIRIAYLYSLTSPSVDRLVLYIDQRYNNGSTGSPNESGLQVVNCDFSKNALLNQTSLVTVIIDGASLIYRLNGTQIGTVTLDAINQPQYPIIACFLFYATGLGTAGNALIGVSTIGQGRSWKGLAMNGDICQIVQYLNAVAA